MIVVEHDYCAMYCTANLFDGPKLVVGSIQASAHETR